MNTPRTRPERVAPPKGFADGVCIPPRTDAERLALAELHGYMVTDSLDGYPIDNNMRFQAQVFSLNYGWVNMWSLKGEFRSDDPAKLEPLCLEFARERGQRARIVELVPTLYKTYEIEEIAREDL